MPTCRATLLGDQRAVARDDLERRRRAAPAPRPPRRRRLSADRAGRGCRGTSSRSRRPARSRRCPAPSPGPRRRACDSRRPRAWPEGADRPRRVRAIATSSPSGLGVRADVQHRAERALGDHQRPPVIGRQDAEPPADEVVGISSSFVHSLSVHRRAPRRSPRRSDWRSRTGSCALT